MSVRIVYEDVAAGAEDNAVVATRDAQDFSDPSLLPQEAYDGAIASLEPYSWRLDGSRSILDGQPIAFWSREMSGAGGRFDHPPEITITFGNRYTSPGLFLVFDTASGDYCTSVTVEWYQGPIQLWKETFLPLGPEAFCGKTVEAYDKLVLRFNATSRPERYAKLTHIVFGVARTFERPELRNVRVTEEVSITSTEVAVNTLDFTLDSKSNVEYMFQLKQPVSAFDGSTLIGVFYINSSKHRASGLYDVACIDAIGVLDESIFPGGMYSGYPARALLEEILDSHFDLELDKPLREAAVTGYLPECSRREALQQVAFALCAMVDTSGSAAIRVYKDKENTPKKLPLERVYTGGTVDTAAVVTAVRVTAHSYSTAGSGNDTVEVDGVTYYHTATVTTIANPNATASDKQNVVDVSNATLVHPGNVSAVVQHLYNYYVMRDTQNVRIVMDVEKPGDRTAAATPWGTLVNGYITSMRITLSGIAAADCEIVGVDVRSVGEAERKVSGEFMSGEV